MKPQEDRLVAEERVRKRQRQYEWLEVIRQPLLRYCLQISGSRWEAEDLLQDTMMRMLEMETKRPAQEIDFRYVCRAARNLWIDRCRRLKRAKVIAQTDAAELANEDGEVSYVSYSGGREAHSAMDVREHLEELAWRLSPKPFVVLLLMEVFDFTAKETAAWLGGTEVAIQVALSRARSRLQSLSSSASGGRYDKGKIKGSIIVGRAPVPSTFFEADLEAFRSRNPFAIQEAYLTLVGSGGQLQRIRAWGGELYFSFRDPNGNILIVSA